MPGPYIHISTVRHAAVSLSQARYVPKPSKRIRAEWTGSNTIDLGNLMNAHPNYAALGAIGPDVFFFLPDFRNQGPISVSSILTTVLSFLEGLYNTLDPYVSKWEKYLGPISEDTAEEMSRLTGGLSETVGDISGELSGILTTILEDFAVRLHDWWEFFSLGLNQGYDDQAYFWSDMLHYRQTEQFGRALWTAAQTSADEGTRAYALGYMSHVATDTTAHAFVNSIAGGPFRSHWQRHHTVENHMDAYWYLHDPLSPATNGNYPQLTESALYYDIAFGANGAVKNRPAYPTGNTLRESWTRRRLLDTDSELPDSIAQLLLQAMGDVFYQGGPHPKILSDDGRPSADQIKQAYDLLFRFLKLTTVDGFNHEPPDPPDVFPNLDFPTPTDPSDGGPPGDGGDGDGGSWWDDILDFILAVINAIAYAVEVAVWLATLPWAVLADLITYPLRLGLYYALELPLFHILKAFRSVLVMTGYMVPMDDEIVPSLMQIGAGSGALQQILGQISDVFGGILGPPLNVVPGVYPDPSYPRWHPDDEYEHPWSYPTDAQQEAPGTTAGPYAGLETPQAFFGDVPADPDLRDALESAETPDQVDQIGLRLSPRRSLGDPLNFSKYLIWLQTRDPRQRNQQPVPLVAWNLDSDRGYGYHCWDWNRDATAKAVDDPELNPFQPPCTWPQQSDDWNPNVPLRLHWVPGPDPGCSSAPPIMIMQPAAREGTVRKKATPSRRRRK